MARRKRGRVINGWLVIDKPSGVTSTQVVNRVRRAMDAQKAGHGGTLDPLATGVLPVAFGEATKTVPFIMDAEKKYRFTARWGQATDTDDSDGEITDESDARPPGEAIRAALPDMTGLLSQTPPAYSAIKIDGQRAYDLARAGERANLAPRAVEIYAAELIAVPDPDHAIFAVTCGKGTYVRAWVRDLAQKLGTVGHVCALRRCQVGAFREENAISLEMVESLGHSAAAHLSAVETPLDDIPAVAISAQEASRLRSGQAILLRGSMTPPVSSPDETATVLCSIGKGKPVALCEYRAGEFKPVRVFNIHP